MQINSADALLARLTAPQEKSASAQSDEGQLDITSTEFVEKLANACDFMNMQLNFISEEDLKEVAALSEKKASAEEAGSNPRIVAALERLVQSKTQEVLSKDAAAPGEGEPAAEEKPTSESGAKKEEDPKKNPLAYLLKRKGEKKESCPPKKSEGKKSDKDEDTETREALGEPASTPDDPSQEKSAATLASLLGRANDAQLEVTETPQAEAADATGEGEKVAQAEGTSDAGVTFKIDWDSLVTRMRTRYTEEN